MDYALKLENVSKHFGGLKAVNNISLAVEKNQIVAVIGPNGAGKTTLFNCITGMVDPTSGKIDAITREKKVQSIYGLRPNKITEKGVARTFQNIRLFSNMTVLENVMLGRHSRLKSGILGAIFRFPSVVKEEKKAVEDSYAILEKIGLEAHVNDLAKNLPYGAQRRLEIARALATDPEILLLDEPAAGMNPQETKELDNLIVKLRKEENITILLIEHDMNLVMSLAENIFVMDYGELIAQGSPEEIKNNKRVIEAYLGEDADA
jgi:branched-chain amino acid transport system ATP-binding protein